MEAETLALAQEIDFSMWGLFARATLTVKLVMIMLVGASAWSWAINYPETPDIPLCAVRGGEV